MHNEQQISLFDDVKELKQKQTKITNKDINELIGIKETFELPDKLIKILLNEEEKDKLLIVNAPVPLHTSKILLLSFFNLDKISQIQSGV